MLRPGNSIAISGDNPPTGEASQAVNDLAALECQSEATLVRIRKGEIHSDLIDLIKERLADIDDGRVVLVSLGAAMRERKLM